MNRGRFRPIPETSFKNGSVPLHDAQCHGQPAPGARRAVPMREESRRRSRDEISQRNRARCVDAR